MKNDQTILLIGGALLLYLLYRNSQGTTAAQASINATNLTAQNTVANTAAIASAAQALGTDFANIATDIP